ncbi:hypothetical protein NMG60_11030012 [Bertholletia excelsa]
MATKQALFLVLSLLCMGGFNFSPVRGISTIGIGDELNSTSFLVSPEGNFTMGFFYVNRTGYSYLGIWYSKDLLYRKVWVANPNTPLLNNDGVLTIDTAGMLKIVSGGNTVLNISGNGTTASLEDSGNFVLIDNANRTIWQSFDHPTDTLLPGMKLGVSNTTGQNWTLTSWLSDFVPATGAFSLRWEPEQYSGELVIYRRGVRYWASGLLQTNQTFPYMPALNSPFSPYHYNLSFVKNDNETYFTITSGPTDSPAMWRLTPAGPIVDGLNLILTPFGEFCYGFKTDTGCVASTVPPCRSSEDEFELKSAYFLPSSAVSEYNNDPLIGVSDCMQNCWNNCTCVGFIVNSNGTGCVTWTGKLDYREDVNNTVPIFVLDQEKSD